MKKDNNNQNKKIFGSLANFSQLGISMGMCVFVGFFLGKTIDQKLNTGYTFMLLFIVLGVAAAYRALFKMLWNKGEKKK